MTDYKPKPLPLKKFMALPTYTMPKISYGKEKLAFYWDKTGRMELYIMDIKTKERKQISQGEIPRAPRTGFTWDRNGKKIFFGKDAAGNEQNDIWMIDLDGNAQALTETPENQEHVGNVSYSNDWITFMSTRHGQMNVFKMQLDGSEVTQLTAADVPVMGGKWSPNDEWIAMVTNEHPTNLENQDIYLMTGDGKDMKRIIRVKEEGSKDNFADWHPDGKSFAFFSDASGLNQVGIFTIETKEINWLSDGTADELGGTFSPNGKHLAVLRNHEATIKPLIYDLETGEKRELKIPSGLAFGVEFLNDNKLLFQYQSTTSRGEVWSYDLTNDTYEVLLEAEYGDIDRSRFVEPEYIRYKSFDGLEIPAIVYKPADIPEGVKLPAIVDVHGGPTAQYFLSFSPRAQYMASEGFVIVLPNIRGSTGYGVEFRDACRKDWGGKDLKDVVHAAEYLKTLPYVDPDRIAVGGGSYGGFMTFIAVTKAPEHWKAGFAWIGITDLFKMYEESMPHFKYFLNRQMGNPVDDKELWHDRSAINFADQMTAKLLILHGVTDPRCPITQARIFRDKLLELGKVEGEDFDYIELTDVGHGGWGDIKTRIKSTQIMIDYFKRVL
ncbi:MAG: prolyl oligopeptidase family serine peptidase [Candidatus Heimdallarchaeota archaeon]|nr:prolyl oligopeptidase family serine peptidase [Candidatus Heimdallarchaeota archaeon]